MNTLALVGGILIAVIIIGSSLWYFFPLAEIPEEKLKQCSSDDDCIKVNDGCCGCVAGGNSTAINKIYNVYWNRKVNKECREVEGCIGLYNCINDEPRCVNNKCKLVSLEE